jgi:predicted RNA-binding protein associated with RNAse of E/G family
MKVLAIDDNFLFDTQFITTGKWYDVSEIETNRVGILQYYIDCDDLGEFDGTGGWYDVDIFKTLDQVRNERLKDILNGK